VTAKKRRHRERRGEERRGEQISDVFSVGRRSVLGD
jgi:hypothetical protein